MLCLYYYFQTIIINSIEIEAVDSEPPSFTRMEAYMKVIAQESHKKSILMKKILKRKASAQDFRYETNDSSMNSFIFDLEPPKRIKIC